MNINLSSKRAKKARLAAKMQGLVEKMLAAATILSAIGGAWLVLDEQSRRGGYGLLGLGLVFLMVILWYRLDLSKNPPRRPVTSWDDILEPGLLASFKKGAEVSPRSAWAAATSQWQGRFLCGHLLLDSSAIAQFLPEDSASMEPVWQAAQDLMGRSGSPQLHGGTLAAALINTSASASEYLAKQNLQPEDVLGVHAWVERLDSYFSQPKPTFGGIGRDWAAGFTPVLDRFGENISREVEAGAGHFHTLAHGDILDSIIHNLGQGSVAIVGEPGTGKTSLAYALAQRLLLGRDEQLRYYQIVSLNASSIISSARDQLERIILTLFNEAAHARNIVIFLDDARLFFGTGTGAMDISQILLPLIQAQRVKLIAAMTPDDLQHLKASNGELMAHLATIAVDEPAQETTMDILEDTAIGLEQQSKILVSYPSIKEAYRLSGQYMQEMAYPGKAISLLEQAVPYAETGLMSAAVVQQAVEKTLGVKAGKAEAAEADVLLHLEDKIHQRMINQQKAVSAVAGALRRGRAGVASPNRPVGSFLFLGPTGVGKTELARSLAAIYFGDERQMIRLDMTEFQGPDDVTRLLSAGESGHKSLLIQIREQPFSVVLLDEVEKSHPNVLNLLLQLLDEGQLTDQAGHPASFKNAIVIATSNAGSAEITQRVGAGESLDAFQRPLVDKLIAGGQFKPELVNRFDEIVLFRPLNIDETAQVAKLMLTQVNKTLANQSISVALTEPALQKVVHAGYDPQFGARPMRRVIQQMVEDAVAKKVLAGEAKPGSVINLDVSDLSGN